MREIGGHYPIYFGCGEKNPASLGLHFLEQDGRVHTRMQLDERFTGAPGFAPGGVAA